MFTIPKEKTVCFSGHRSEKLPDNGSRESVAMGVIRSLIYQEINNSINDGYTCFMTGLARGIDLIAGELVLNIKRTNPSISLVAVVPYPEQQGTVHGYDKFVYGCILDEADAVIQLSDKYYRGCLKNRNQFMVDNSSKLIAAVDDYKSGTGQTISLARKKGIDIAIINVREIRELAEDAKANPIELIII